MTPIDFLKDSYLTFKGIQTYHTFLKNSCYWGKNKMEQYQFEQLQKLLVSAYEGIEYYKNTFDSIGFDPRTDFKTLADMQKLPILSKEEARELGKKHLADQRYHDISLSFRTSGSSGNPFEINVHPNQWIIEQGVAWRHWKWAGYNFRDVMAIVRSYVPPSPEQFFKKERLRNFLYFSPFQMNDEYMDKYLNTMISEKVTVLRGYPSSLATLGEYVLRTNHPIPNIKLALTSSEVLTNTDRNTIEKAFKTKVSNNYGLAEQIVMMGDCEKHEGLHNYDEYGYLELLDTEQPNIKRIIGTNLHNIAMPLIRYDTGDLAEIAEKPCSCGKTLPTIKNIIGRQDAAITTAEGFSIPTVNFYTLFETFTDIFKWQIVQHSLYDIEVIIKPKPAFLASRIDDIRQGFANRLPPSIVLTININKPFIQKHEGKTNTFIKMF